MARHPEPTAGDPPTCSAQAGTMARMRQFGVQWRTPLLMLTVAVVGIAVLGGLRHLVDSLDYDALTRAMAATPYNRLAAAILATAISYLALTGYDLSALRYVGVTVRPATAMLTAFIAYAVGNSVGLGVMTGGAVRMRLYTAAGLETSQIFRVIGFNAGAFGLGVTVFGAAGMLWGAHSVTALLPLPAVLLQAGAALALLAIAGFIGLCAWQSTLRIGRWTTLSLPPAGLVLQQVVISVIDLAACAAALWFLMPQTDVSFAGFLVYFAIAISLGVLSHVPGGLGVFEGVMLLAYGSLAPMETILGALILFRGVYFLLPLALATLLLVDHELHRATDTPVGRAAAHLSPVLLAIFAFMAGVWLLLSGVTPTTAAAQDLLALRVPLAVVEAAHLIGSLVGLALLFIARGLLHRLDAAWWAALVLTVVAAVLALPKGVAWVEALGLAGLGGLLWVFRAEFNRRSSLLGQSFETEWLIAVALVLGAMIWLLFLAYRDIDYAHALWWQFAFDAHVSRSLRAVTVVILVAAALGMWQLFRPAGAAAEIPVVQALDQAAAIVHGQDSSEACLALMGDKALLFSASGTAFIMYGQKGRSWVALSDPVGDPAEGPNLVWRFVELAGAHGGRAVFYQVTPATLPWYLDAGLRVFKLGEAAHVPLADFSLKGPQRAPLRHADNRAQREGLGLEILAPEDVHAVLGEIRAISDAWLANQNTREKSFSLGAFDPAYLQRLPLALVRQGGRAVAFANLLLTETRQEVRIDLMRYLPDAPPSTMDFLLIRLMLHYQAEGVARFGLGMAPLAGMAQHDRAPTWQQMGRLFFEHGERFYNFQGVRRFKEKFDPVWEPRYLAAPGGLAPLMALADIAALISGGLRGVVAK